MRTKYWLVNLSAMVLCGAVLLGSGDRSWSADDFYVIGGSAPWKRNGNNIYYTDGNVGIGTNSPTSPLTIISPYTYPLFAQSTAIGANAIMGVSNATTGDSRGVYGQSASTNSPNACGVYGTATGFGAGVYGYNNSSTGCGVFGANDSVGGAGIHGESLATTGGGWGVYGHSASTNANNAYGVYGFATGLGAGTKGETDSATAYGVVGINSADGGTAIIGRCDGGTGNGVIGEGPGIGVNGVTHNPNGYGVLGTNTAGGFGVVCDGDFAAFGAKNAIVPTSKGQRKLYSQESPEAWFEDFGEGQLVDGQAHIALDPLFLETVTIDEQHPLKVFIQLNDDCSGVYVKRQAAGFEVKELKDGTGRAHFTYRVVAKRKGFETARLDTVKDAQKYAALKAPQK
jgi:hypothetical protein